MELTVFLNHAARLEFEAYQSYLAATAVMEARGDIDAKLFFREMAGHSRTHLDVTLERAGLRDASEIPTGLPSLWDKLAPEAPEIPDSTAEIGLEPAIALALAAERRAVQFYAQIAASAKTTETRELAEVFAEEERSHVLALERFLGLTPY